MEWWQTALVAILVGLAVAALGARIVGHQREMGRSRAAATLAQRDTQRKERDAAKEAASAEAERRQAAAAEVEELQRLEAERVGAVFRQRSDRDDPGIILSVEALDPTSRLHRVIVSGEPSPNRGERNDNLPPGGRTSMEWRFLTMPEAEQRHRTARLFEDSFDDADGWIEVERLA